MNLCIPLWIRIIPLLENDNYPTQIMKNLDITYSHISQTIGMLTFYNIIQKKRRGRRIYCSLTSVGEELLEPCKMILEIEKSYKEKTHNYVEKKDEAFPSEREKFTLSEASLLDNIENGN